MKLKELKGLTSEELNSKEKDFRKQVFELNQKRKLGTLDKPSQFKNTRKIIARIQTIIRERELDNERKK